MAEFRQGVITARGLDLLARAQAGTATITFTRARIGNGEWAEDTPMETIMASVALRNAKAQFPVANAEFVNDATSLLTIVASNVNNTSGYYITEVGVYATDGETEILYAMYLATAPDWFPAYNNVTPFSVTYSCYITVANAESVMVIQRNIEIDDTAGEGDYDKVWSASKTSRAISAACSTLAQTTRDEIAFLKNILKTELIQLLQHVVYTDNNSSTYYNAFRNALDSSLINLSSISAVFNPGSAVIYESTSLNSLKQYLTVTGTYSDNSTVAIDSNDYTLSGTLTAGTSTITVSYNNKTTTFTVSVAESPTLSSISAVFNPGSTVIYESTSLNSLKQYLTVTGTYSDNSTATIDSNDYTLSGTLTAGTSTVTVSYDGKTTTFTVTVSNNAYTAQAIYTNYAPNGERFSTGNISIDFAGGDYVEAVIDASSADVVSQTNLISIAQDGSNDYLDYSTGEAVLVYKRDQSGTMKVLIRVKDTANNVAIDKWVVPNDFSNLVIKLDKNGVYLDGTAISDITASDLAFLTGQNTIAIGARASKLSYATYSSVTVYRVQ